ncbi:SpoIIE family protein phosphatase [Actinoplanes oblitus]|uniref:SpoIIE family protein phosphatase n=1 Tax=Actinoplanes oblitus TaxID=3040509 RepID=A0ABY8WWP8_9ACTN|nr:SpoIIE family protein phosphatase [Actinoplanes oblitus]WIN00666.1 SpoIIE family protein phosphatase [Actinoplanes oblitus]
MSGAPREYLQRLAEIDDAVARARPDPMVLVERAAGLLAGRVGCRVDEAQAQLRQIAAERGRAPAEVAQDLLAALESRPPTTRQTVRTAVEKALRRPSPAARAAPRKPAAHPTGQQWAGSLRQVLAALPGNHTVLLPVRRPDGTITDYDIVAVSPAAVDLSGRHGDTIVGGRVSEIYPGVAGGPIWQAWADTLADGVAREVGPITYEGGDGPAPFAISLVVRVHPIGPGLLHSWLRPDEQQRMGERIAQTERLGNLGWGEWDLLSGRTVWSDEMYRIYEREPEEGPLTDEEAEALRLPEDEAIHQEAAATFGRGETVDITYRARIGGRIKHLRSVVDAVRDVEGRPVRIYGITQDVTARETSRAKLAEVEQQLHRQRETLEAEHQLAGQLQQVILPLPPGVVDLPGLRMAVRYLPAEQASQVGGDWFHAAATRDGKVLLAIGDVAGHGIRAATTMARLRHAVDALSVTSTTDPAELLRHLNRLLYTDWPDADTATALIARFDPAEATLTWSQAGHPPPLLARDGAARPLDRPTGMLLGARTDPVYETTSVRLAPGDLLLLYTDGLIEDRGKSITQGFAPVLCALGGSAPDEPLTDILARLRRANPQDDTCILALRRTADGS